MPLHDTWGVWGLYPPGTWEGLSELCPHHWFKKRRELKGESSSDEDFSNFSDDEEQYEDEVYITEQGVGYNNSEIRTRKNSYASVGSSRRGDNNNSRGSNRSRTKSRTSSAVMNLAGLKAERKAQPKQRPKYDALSTEQKLLYRHRLVEQIEKIQKNQFGLQHPK